MWQLESLDLAVERTLVAFVGGNVTLVGDMVPVVCGAVALVGQVVPLVGDPLPFVRDGLAEVGQLFAFVGEPVPVGGDSVPCGRDPVPFVGDPFAFGDRLLGAGRGVTIGVESGLQSGLGGEFACLGGPSPLLRVIGPAGHRGPAVKVGLAALLGGDVA